MSDQDSFNAGQGGQSLPQGGDIGSWQAGRSVRAWNDAERARQDAVWMPKPESYTAPPVSMQVNYHWVAGKGIRNNPIMAIVGLVLLVFVALPLIQYSVPLWIALYPGAAIGAALIYGGVYLGLKEMIFAAISAFIGAWVLTLVEHAQASKRSYWTIRHFVRLGTLFIWAIFALSLRQLNLMHMPDLSRAGLPQMIITPSHLVLAAAFVAVMHFWLWRFRPWA